MFGKGENVKRSYLKKIKYLLMLGISLLTVVSSVQSVLLARAPTGSFTHGYSGTAAEEAVSSRAVYAVSRLTDIRGMGIPEGIEKIADIATDDDGNFYLLTSDGRLFLLDGDFKLSKEYKITSADGEPLEITGARGILPMSSDDIYIADTENERVIEINGGGRVTREITKPDSRLIPEDFKFAPIKLERDSKGTLYVLCDGAYYGALLFAPSGEFSGFYGANTVKGSALTTLSYLWDALTKNDDKRAYSVKKLPYRFFDLSIDKKDFVYTCTGQTDNASSNGQIKKLSPNGVNILYKSKPDGTKTDAGSYNFGEASTEKRNNKTVVQNFTSIQTDERGYIYALDSTYGIIYVYDSESNLITAFGGGKGKGMQAGVFSAPEAIAYGRDKLAVADSQNNSVTVFSLTDYGRTLMSAQSKTLSADYKGSKSEWESVIREDSSNQLAMRGLAKAYFAEGDYKTAREYAKAGYDFVTYSQALGKTGSEFINKNFVWIFLLAVAVIGAAVIFTVEASKKKIVLIRNAKVRLLFNTVTHPFDSFNSIKYKNMGSLVIAAALTVLFYITAVISEMLSDFRFTSFSPLTSSAALQLVKTAGLVILFSVANWAVCVLMEGKGRLKEVFIVTAYATVPQIIYNLVFTLLSHIITSPSSTLLSGLSTVAAMLTGIVLTVGLMVIHEFSFPKFLGSILLTAFAMLLIIFIIFMLGMLLSQLWSFLVTVFMETAYR